MAGDTREVASPYPDTLPFYLNAQIRAFVISIPWALSGTLLRRLNREGVGRLRSTFGRSMGESGRPTDVRKRG
jgi:hypothetical protein